MKKPRRFEGQAAWITGSGSGIGRALAIELAQQGAAVALSGRREARLIEVAKEIEALGARALPLPCDVTDESQVARAADAVASAFGKIDVAIANAGFSVAGPIEALSADDLRRQLDVNVVGVAMTAKHALSHLRVTGGRLGIVGSVMGFMPARGTGAYAASKYAVRAIGQCLEIELAGSGVSVTTLHPGFVESEIGQVDNEGAFHADRTDRRPRALLWPTDRAARVMVNALYRRKGETVFTAHGKVGAFLGRHAPGLVIFAQRKSRK